MEIVINLELGEELSLQQIQNTPCISTILFSFIVDEVFEKKIQKIIHFTSLLSKYPMITTKLKFQQIKKTNVKQYSVLALGGTFDYLHIGHQIFLLYAALAATSTIIIGVTGEKLLANKKHKEFIQPLDLRMKNVQDFIKAINPKLKLSIFQLNNPYGPTIESQEIECLLTSPQTSKAIIKINELRISQQLKPLEMIVCPLLSATKEIQGKISSSSIRQHLMKKNGMKKEQIEQYQSFYHLLINRLNKQLQAQKKLLAEIWWNNIFIRYSQSWRFYHTNQHIYNMLKMWSSEKYQKVRQELQSFQIIIIELTIFFHDIVYQPNSIKNQHQSSVVAEQFIEDYLGNHHIKQRIKQTVKQLILDTQKHIPNSKLSQIIYDLDMGILNSDQGKYKQYASKVKKQYLPFFKESYNFKRKQFLLKTLQQKLHFSFDPENLKSNLQWQLYCLEHDDV